MEAVPGAARVPPDSGRIPHVFPVLPVVGTGGGFPLCLVPFAFAGVSLCDERLFKDAPDGRFSLNLLWDRALAKGKLYGVRLDGRWMHVGTPKALAEAEATFEREGA